MSRKMRLIVVSTTLATVALASFVLVQAKGDEHQLPPEKQEVLDREEDIQARTTPGSKEKLRRDIPKHYELKDRWPTGIFEDPGFPSTEFAFTTRWTENLKKYHISIFAGAYADEESKGLILIQTTSLDLQHTRIKIYPAPAGAGELTIVEVDKMVLTLESKSGDKYSFDVSSKTYGSP